MNKTRWSLHDVSGRSVLGSCGVANTVAARLDRRQRALRPAPRLLGRALLLAQRLESESYTEIQGLRLVAPRHAEQQELPTLPIVAGEWTQWRSKSSPCCRGRRLDSVDLTPDVNPPFNCTRTDMGQQLNGVDVSILPCVNNRTAILPLVCGRSSRRRGLSRVFTGGMMGPLYCRLGTSGTRQTVRRSPGQQSDRDRK